MISYTPIRQGATIKVEPYTDPLVFKMAKWYPKTIKGMPVFDFEFDDLNIDDPNEDRIAIQFSATINGIPHEDNLIYYKDEYYVLIIKYGEAFCITIANYAKYCDCLTDIGYINRASDLLVYSIEIYGRKRLRIHTCKTDNSKHKGVPQKKFVVGSKTPTKTVKV